MKNISLYAYSIDQEIMDWLQFLVEKEDSKIIICKSEQELEQLYEHSPPDILLIDDHEVKQNTEHSTAELIDIFVPRKKRGVGMVVVLSSHASEIEYRVDLLLKGADYIIEKPVNMVELIARITAMVRHQQYIQEHIGDYITQTRDIVTFDVMDRIMTHLNDHIKPIITSQIDMVDKFQSTEQINDEIVGTLKNNGIEVLASINAIRDDVHNLISAREHKNEKGYDHLEHLFQKNLDLIHMAYDGYSKEKNL